jgi:catabolite regulation protein CreA
VQLSQARRQAVQKGGALALAATLALSPRSPAVADGDKTIVGETQTSGFLFKDTLRIERFSDPKVSGVELYLSDFSLPVTEKLAKGDVFSDPSQGGLGCSKKGRVVVSPGASTKLEGEEVFQESRSLLFKSLKVRRYVDREGGNVVYAVYSERLNKGDDNSNARFKSNLCAVPVDEFGTQ